MTWDAYTVFSVLSGGALVILGFIPAFSLRDRLGAIAAGAIFVVYGIYTASQTSGIYFFSVLIFIIPPALLLYLVAALIEATPRRSGKVRADRAKALSASSLHPPSAPHPSASAEVRLSAQPGGPSRREPPPTRSASPRHADSHPAQDPRRCPRPDCPRYGRPTGERFCPRCKSATMLYHEP